MIYKRIIDIIHNKIKRKRKEKCSFHGVYLNGIIETVVTIIIL